MYIHIFNEIRDKMNKMFETGIFVKYQSNSQYKIYNSRKNVIKIFIAVKFNETHLKKPLFNQEWEKKELEPSEAESDTDEEVSAPQNGSGASNDVSSPQNRSETINKNENAPVSIRYEEKWENLLIPTKKNAFEMGNDLSISVKNDLSISVERNDLQAGNNLQNPVKTNENRTNDLIPQTPSKPAAGRSIFYFFYLLITLMEPRAMKRYIHFGQPNYPFRV